MTIENIIDGLQILRTYPGAEVACEHDIFFAGPMEPSDVSEEDSAKLLALGWFVDDECNSWAAFT